MRTERPPKQSRPQSAKVIDCGTGRMIVTRLSDPIGELTVCVEFHDAFDGMKDVLGHYKASISFALLTDEETKNLTQALADT